MWGSAFTQHAVTAALQQTDRFTADGKTTVFRTRRQFLMAGSVQVYADSESVDTERETRIDYIRGVLMFRTPPDSGRTVSISYQYIPLHIKPAYRLWEPAQERQAADARKYGRKEPVIKTGNAEQYQSQLTKSGSIFRGIEIGTNQGMRLQSGLRLQVSGAIMEGVDIIASLTDQNTPIQPEGNTQTLREIDKVFITVKTRNIQTTFGDYVYNAPGSAFGSYSRKLQGATGTVSHARGSVSMFAAASRGVFTTNHFTGQEGNQGPYQLYGAKGERQIIVLAGTEKVWIDGEPVTRGEDNDYTIEYSNGQIIFTRNRLITSDSRITVDFEYSAQNFQKQIYGVTSNTNVLDNALTVKASIIREQDDRDNPVDFAMTDEYKRILASAGDNPDSALAPGARFAGQDSGAYRQEEINGKTVYRYAGAGNGDYSVRFSYVGPGRGDYSFKGYGIYMYEGENSGSYLPVVFLPLAKSHTVADVSVSANITDWAAAGGEIAASHRDENLFSSDDDGDNGGVAYTAYLNVPAKELRIFQKGLGALSMSGSVRDVGRQFMSLGRMTEIEHGRVWGQEEGQVSGENIQHLSLLYSPVKSLNISGETGSMKRFDSFKSKRSVLTAELKHRGLPSFRYQKEDIRTSQHNKSTGSWVRENAFITWKKLGFSPGLFYTGEHKSDTAADTVRDGFKYNEWEARIGFAKKRFSLRAGHTMRDESRYTDNALQKNSLARTTQVSGDYSRGRTFSASARYTHRSRTYAVSDMQDQKSDLADCKLRIAPERGFMRTNIHYKFTSTSLSEMVQDTIQVDPGLGNYRFDDINQEYVPDPDGDILFRTIQTGDFVPVNEVRVGGDMVWNLKKLLKKPPRALAFLTGATTRSRVRIERAGRSRNFRQVNRAAFCPAWNADSLTVSASVSQQHDLDYRFPESYTHARVRYKSSSIENNRLVGRHFINHIKEKSVRVKGTIIKKLGYSAEYVSTSTFKEYTSGSSTDRDIHGSEFSAEFSYRPRQKMEFALKGRVSSAIDQRPEPVTKAAALFIVPSFSYAIQNRGHIRAELEAGTIKADPAGRGLPYEMFNGDQPGTTLRWRVLVTYQVSDHVQATVNYRGRREPWRKSTYQTGQVEVRAFF